MSHAAGLLRLSQEPVAGFVRVRFFKAVIGIPMDDGRQACYGPEDEEVLLAANHALSLAERGLLEVIDDHRPPRAGQIKIMTSDDPLDHGEPRCLS